MKIALASGDSKTCPWGSISWNRKLYVSPRFMSKKRFNESLKGLSVWATACSFLTKVKNEDLPHPLHHNLHFYSCFPLI
jgi:hypothetical protein